MTQHQWAPEYRHPHQQHQHEHGKRIGLYQAYYHEDLNGSCLTDTAKMVFILALNLETMAAATLKRLEMTLQKV